MKQFLTIVLLFIITPGYSQNIELDVHKKKLKEFLSIEQNLKSEKVETEVTYMVQKGVAQPVLFKRKQANLPDLIISYFYFEKDSSISSILYEWDDKTVNGQNPTKTPIEISSFIDLYTKLYDQVHTSFGESKSTGDLKDLSKITTGDFEKTDLWDPNDSTQVYMYINLSSKYEKRGNVTINPTYRIRLEAKNQKKANNALGKPDDKKIKELDLVFKNFLTELQNKNYEKVKLTLSDQIVNNVTNEQLEVLRKNIKFNDPLEMFMFGLQIGLDGTSYIKLQYKYKSDTNMPPKELLNITFDESNKILGLQPSKRF